MLSSDRWSPTHVRFVGAWAIGFPTLFLMDVHDGFGSLLLPSGALLIWSGLALARDTSQWERFVRALSSRHPTPTLPAFARLGVRVQLRRDRCRFALGGVLGMLALFGLYEYP